MSTNEASNDAASAPDAPKPATPAPARAPSRFYSRMNRGFAAPAASPASGPTAEGLTVEEAVALKLKDNLPVRATAGDVAEYTPRESEGGDGFREHRGRDRDDRGERRGRGRDRDREGGRGSRGGFDRDERRDERPAPARLEEPQAEALPPATEPAEAAPVDAVPADEPVEEAPRRVRFEDAPTERSSRSVQEFRPSRDRSYAEEAARNRAESAPAAEKPKSSGLFGWMKSIIGGGASGEAPATEETSRPAGEDRGRGREPRDRGPRGGQGRGGPGGGGRGEGGQGGGEGDGNRRRRRRRGGRNRTRGGGGGGAPQD